jgi:hypothetical protein
MRRWPHGIDLDFRPLPCARRQGEWDDPVLGRGLIQAAFRLAISGTNCESPAAPLPSATKWSMFSQPLS